MSHELLLLGCDTGNVDTLNDVVRGALLVQYYFDEGSGTTLIDHASGYNGTLGTGGADQPDWVAQGLSFVAANADVVVATTMPDAGVLGAITISVVANITTGSAAKQFAGKHLTNGATANPFDYGTDAAVTPNLNFVRANTAPRIWVGPATTLSSYKMYSIVAPAAIDTAPTFYVGTTPTTGTSGGGTGVGASTGSGANLRVGRRADGLEQMNGIIAYALIYGRALSALEIGQNFDVLKQVLAARGIVL